MCGCRRVGVDVFEVSTDSFLLAEEIHIHMHFEKPLEGVVDIQSTIRPLHLLDNIQTRMDDELVHVLRRLGESKPRNAIAAGFRGAEGDAEQGHVGGGEDGEVVGHVEK